MLQPARLHDGVQGGLPPFVHGIRVQAVVEQLGAERVVASGRCDVCQRSTSR